MKRIFGNWWVLTGLIVALLLLVFCVGLPLVVLGLAPLYVRLLLGLVIVGVWALLGTLRVLRARKAAAAIEAELAAPSAGDAESAAVAGRMAEALAALKGSSGGRRDYLYNRPWYVIIGPPGAGKTTALLNSGLRFPLADQSVKGVGGTRNLDFWFADEAALVDTAGRYATQDSDASVDAKGWQSFLSMMKKHRPRSPINGVIVALGVDELMRADRAGLDRHAALVRRRLGEVRATLEVAVPVYLLLTKADLLAGFVEYYGDLDVEGRRAVLGATLPLTKTQPRIEDVLTSFDAMVTSQGARQAKRLFDEADQTRRGLILGFPTQLAALRNRLARFVDGAFIAGDKPPATLRGYYFASGVQQGAPLDRILSGVAQVYQGSAPAAASGSGRTYFLNRLLTEVIFPEAGLVQADPAARKRQQRRMMMGVAGVAAASALVLVAWAVSFTRNHAFQSALNSSAVQAAQQIHQTGDDLVEARASDPDLEQSLNVLNTLRNLPQGYAEQAAGEPGLTMRFGLYQSGLAAQSVEAYRGGLRRIMLPRLLLRLEQFMAGHNGDPLSLYQALKVYLMLGDQGPMDTATVKQWVTSDWANQQFPGADRQIERKQLGEHLAALLEGGDLNIAWAGQKAPLDGTVIASARAALATLSLADRAYAVLRQKAIGSGAPWQADAAISAGDAQAFANGPLVLQMQVPYFYTRAGYDEAYLPGLATVAEDMRKDIWVMGDAAGTAGVQEQMSQIRPGVAALYAKDYIAAWDKVATVPQPANYFADPAAMGAFAKAPSPLKVLLLELRKNTTFTGGAQAAQGMLAARISASKVGKFEKLLPSGGGGMDASAQITNYFKPLQDYVGDGKTPAPLDTFIDAIKQNSVAVASAKAAGGGLGATTAQGAMATAQGTLAGATVGAPPQMQGFVAAAATGGKTASNTAAQGAITEAYAKTVLPDCTSATQDKYPFVGTSAVNASLIDVQRVFGMGGSFDAFAQQRVLPLLDRSGPVWRWSATDPTAANLSPSSPDEFHKAADLRDTLVGGITVKFAAKGFGGGVDAVVLTVGAATYRFDSISSTDQAVTWSAQGNVPRAMVEFYAAGAKVATISEDGPWALFRLMDAAHKENAGPQTITATFGSAARTAVFKITLPGDSNPFGRGGVWSFRCPTAL
ncbi:type VI secretion system membrane subunit TssM [Novosphingobium sp.]|uniref:type VI secretion system membrane subunit TssM n=1 Tax=Novosphingobium sp. TaxID=1874826 RepID=UPI003B52983A